MNVRRIGFGIGATIVATGLIVGTLAFSRATAGGAAPLPGLTDDDLSALRDQMVETAERWGEPDPIHGVIVATTSRRWWGAQPEVQLTDEAPDFDVYVLAFEGDLTAYDASPPPVPSAPSGHAALPTGHFAYLVASRDTVEVTEFGLGHEPLPVATLGPSLSVNL